MPDRLSGLLPSLPGPDSGRQSLSTQEQAWAAAPARCWGGTAGRQGRAGRTGDGSSPHRRGPLITAATVARNLDERPVWETLSVTGVPATPLPASRNQMRISRKFMALDGTPLDLDHLRQNTVFILLLEGQAEDGQDHRAMLLHGLPAGWEITARLNAGDVPGLPWLGRLSETEAQPAADDRYAAVVALTGEQPDFRVAARIRAVTPGSYELPGAELADMYRPALFARQNAGPDHGLADRIEARWLSRRTLVAALVRSFCWPVRLCAGSALPARFVAPRRVGTEMVDRSGRPLAFLPAAGGVWRFRAWPRMFRPGSRLLIAVEDRRFWVHPGVDPLALVRAAVQWAELAASCRAARHSPCKPPGCSSRGPGTSARS